MAGGTVTLIRRRNLEPGLAGTVAMRSVDTMVEAVDKCATRYGIEQTAALGLTRFANPVVAHEAATLVVNGSCSTAH